MRGHNLKNRLQTFFCDKVYTLLFILTFLFIVGSLLSMAFPSKSIFHKSINSIDTIPSGELFDGEELVLKFNATKESLTGLSFTVSTYGREVSGGTVVLRLLDEDGTELFSKEVAGKAIQDRSQLEFKFPQITSSKDKKYSVHIHTSGIQQNTAIAFMANENIIEGVSTTLNGVPCSNLVLTLQYVITVPYYNLRYAFDMALIAATLFVLTVVAFGRNRQRADVPEK